LTQPNAVNEIPHVFLYFSCKKFIKSSSSKSVNEILNLVFDLGKSESEVDIDIDIGVIFGGTSLDRSIIVDDIFGNHTGHSSSTAIAPMSTRSHNALTLSTRLFKDCEVGRDIEFDIATTTLVASLYHYHDALLIIIGLGLHHTSSFT
jgi:hypothetical protein